MDYKPLMRVDLRPHHLSPGRTRHILKDASGSRPFPPFKALERVQFEGDGGFYLMYVPESGTGTDTWHQSIDDALHQAEWEFDVKPGEWMKL
jgi:hypothetical protein